ncbi:MAG: serine/threonine protein kinase [Gammaproteobacteria bacterium]|nr:serine/threonine protein kinase [Gammaproteobacteria bacterium]
MAYNRSMEIPGYAIQATIGQGGMATAFLAIQKSLDRQVVLKVLNADAGPGADIAAARFLNEGRIVAGLSHPNIITIFDTGQHAGRAYISMEYIDGGDLRERLQKGTYSGAAALDVIEQVARGLGAAHKHGVIHRDVKPANILFRRNGTPILTDFGIAKRLAADGNLTITGMFIGSPNYMPPEQAEGLTVDGRADIYSLGVIFFEMIAGRKPFASDSVVDVIHLHRSAPIPALPPAAADYQELLELMLAKQRGERFRDVEALLAYISELRQAIAEKSGAADDRAVTLRPASARRGLAGSLLANPRRIVLLGLLVVSTLVYTGLQVAVHRLNAPSSLPPAVVVADFTPDLTGQSLPQSIADPQPEHVIEALRWLAQHSLDENRLLAPPGDNAYYYYSRLAGMAPVDAQAGMQAIAARFLFLAERALADGDSRLAMEYLAAGRRVDPANQEFAAVEAVARGRTRGLFGALVDLFR